jgi:hypothetical protein
MGETVRPWEELHRHFEGIRSRYNCDRKLHFSEISGKKWTRYDQTVLEVLQLAVDAIKSKNVSPPLQRPLMLKLAIMFYPSNLRSLERYGGGTKQEKRLRYDETMLRILLKGAAHYLYGDDHKVQILQLVSDGQPAHRKFSARRLLWQLYVEEERGRVPVREYIDIAQDASICHVSSDHKAHAKAPEYYIHANYLQIADLLLGAIRYIYFAQPYPIAKLPSLGDQCDDKRALVISPVRKMLDKMKRGRAFRHSGHYRSFAISQIKLQDDSVIFARLDPPPVGQPNANTSQLRFFEQ